MIPKNNLLYRCDPFLVTIPVTTIPSDSTFDLRIQFPVPVTDIPP